MCIENMLLSELQKYEKYIPSLANFITRVSSKSYEEFVTRLYQDIDQIINRIEENPELRKEDSEDRLTVEFVTGLSCLGYDVTHESKHGGHTDLMVKSYINPSWTWIGEAKKHSDYTYLLKGFLQLSTRYTNGSSNQNQGGLLIYISVKNAQSVIDRWKQILQDEDLTDFKSTKCQLRKESFCSAHTHESSGNLFHVRHMPVLLYFEPKDRNVKIKNKSDF